MKKNFEESSKKVMNRYTVNKGTLLKTGINGISYSHTINDFRIVCGNDLYLKTYSSALVGGGKNNIRQIINHFISKSFPPNAYERMLDGLKRKYSFLSYGANANIVLLTAVPMWKAKFEMVSIEGLKCFIMVTAGVSNACSPSDKPINLFKRKNNGNKNQNNVKLNYDERNSDQSNLELIKTNPVGTINIVVIIDAKVPDWLLLNSFILITEAKSDLLNRIGIKTKQGNSATGTTTDTITICSTESGDTLKWGGLATQFGFELSKQIQTLIEKSLFSKNSLLRNSSEIT